MSVSLEFIEVFFLFFVQNQVNRIKLCKHFGNCFAHIGAVILSELLLAVKGIIL